MCSVEYYVAGSKRSAIGGTSRVGSCRVNSHRPHSAQSATVEATPMTMVRSMPSRPRASTVIVASLVALWLGAAALLAPVSDEQLRPPDFVPEPVALALSKPCPATAAVGLADTPGVLNISTVRDFKDPTAVLVSDDGALTAAVDEAIAANPDVADKVRGGKVAAVGALVGAVMKATRGQADAGRVRELLLEKLGVEG